MKIRTGFVSNSSSSSFIVYGVMIEDVILEKLLGSVRRPDLYEDEPNYGLDEDLGKALGGSGLSYIRDWDNRSYYVGLIPWSDQGDDETKGQFKERARKVLTEFMKKPVEPELHTGIIYG